MPRFQGINLELNLTLRCNLRCANCNRLCDLYPDRGREEDMDVGQVARFIGQLMTSPVKIKRLKLLGGEPLLHPDFVRIYGMLVEAIDAKLIRKIKVETNGTIPRPAVRTHPKIHWCGKRPNRKRHAPVLWSPRDMGYQTKGPCKMPFLCGPSLDAYGYALCSVCPAMFRVFGREDFYVAEFPGHWQEVFAEAIRAMCPDCLWSMPVEWLELHSFPLDKTMPIHRLPTATWKAAMASWDGHAKKARW